MCHNPRLPGKKHIRLCIKEVRTPIQVFFTPCYCDNTFRHSHLTRAGHGGAAQLRSDGSRSCRNCAPIPRAPVLLLLPPSLLHLLLPHALPVVLVRGLCECVRLSNHASCCRLHASATGCLPLLWSSSCTHHTELVVAGGAALTVAAGFSGAGSLASATSPLAGFAGARQRCACSCCCQTFIICNLLQQEEAVKTNCELAAAGLLFLCHRTH